MPKLPIRLLGSAVRVLILVTVGVGSVDVARAQPASRGTQSAGPGFAHVPIPDEPALATLAAGRIGVAFRVAGTGTPAAAFNSGRSWLWSTPVALRVVRRDGTVIAELTATPGTPTVVDGGWVFTDVFAGADLIYRRDDAEGRITQTLVLRTLAERLAKAARQPAAAAIEWIEKIQLPRDVVARPTTETSEGIDLPEFQIAPALVDGADDAAIRRLELDADGSGTLVTRVPIAFARAVSATKPLDVVSVISSGGVTGAAEDCAAAIDLDRDGIGDACDADADGDGIEDAEETAAGLDPRRRDTDGDGVRDGMDPFPADRARRDDDDAVFLKSRVFVPEPAGDTAMMSRRGTGMVHMLIQLRKHASRVDAEALETAYGMRILHASSLFSMGFIETRACRQ